MAMATSAGRVPRPSGLADVLELILDKGMVIDAYVRVSVIGIEVITIDARIVIVCVDTYLRFAEAVNRLHLEQADNAATIQEPKEGGATEKVKGAFEAGKEGLGSTSGFGKKDEEQQEQKQNSSKGFEEGVM